MGLAGFGGKADSVKPDLQRYLPYQIVDKTSDEYKIKQKLTTIAVKTFWRLRDSGKLPGYIEQTFAQNKKLFEILKEQKNV